MPKKHLILSFLLLSALFQQCQSPSQGQDDPLAWPKATNTAKPWAAWAHERGYQIKNQAHGSPGNLLDLYAAADIPECASFSATPFDIPGLRRDTFKTQWEDPDPIMIKMAAAAAHVAGRPLTSAESMTWLGDHFRVSLSAELKKAGIHDYSIFLDEDSGVLFAVQKLEDNNTATQLPQLEIMKKWWAYMADIMETNPDNSPVVKPLRMVFHLE